MPGKKLRVLSLRKVEYRDSEDILPSLPRIRIILLGRILRLTLSPLRLFWAKGTLTGDPHFRFLLRARRLDPRGL